MFLEFQIFTRIWKNGTVAKDVAKRLNISTATLYEYGVMMAHPKNQL